MTKTAFLDGLRHGLQGLPDKDVLSSLDYYAEMIDDRVESGMTEESAVAELGAPETIAHEIILNLPLPKIIRSKCQKKTAWRVWEIILLVLGSPIWLPLLLTAAVLLLTVYAVLWVVVACLWAVDLSFGAMTIGGMLAGVVSAAGGSVPTALLYVGVALMSAGLGVVSFLGCIKLTVVFAKLSASFGRWIKSWFVSKEKRPMAG